MAKKIQGEMDALKAELADESRMLPTHRNGIVTQEEQHEFDDEQMISDIIRDAQDSGSVVQIKRKRTGDSQYDTMAVIPAEDFSIEYVRIEMGGGSYKASIKNADRKFVKNFAFSIAECYEGKMDIARSKKSDNGHNPAELARAVADLVKPAPVLPPDNSGLHQMIALMMTSQSESNRAALAAQAENTKTMMTLMTALISRPEPTPQQNGGDFSNAITPILIKMIESSSQKSTGLGLDVKGLIELRDFLTPEPVEKPSIIDSILAAAPAFLPMLSPALAGSMKPPQGFQQMSPDVASSPSQPTSRSEAVPVPLPAASGDNSPPKFELLSMLKRGAENETDPESYAYVVADMVGENGLTELINLLMRPEWKNLFEKSFSAVEIEWVAEWREVVLHLLDDDEVIEPIITNHGTTNQTNPAIGQT